VVGTSAVGSVVREREDMEDMEEEGVWVLWGGGGVVNESRPRSGSKGELDGEGEGV